MRGVEAIEDGGAVERSADEIVAAGVVGEGRRVLVLRLVLVLVLMLELDAALGVGQATGTLLRQRGGGGSGRRGLVVSGAG